MTIACTRCGASQDGDIILPVITFKFKHNRGCGHGVGPLTLLPSNKKPKRTGAEIPPPLDKATKLLEALDQSEVKESDVRISPKGKPIDEPAKKSKSKIEKLKVFGKKD
jgi:hypothetical protein